MSSYKIHYPTEQFGFIEFETDNRDEALKEYSELKNAFMDKVGHNTKEWARVRNTYAKTNVISIDDVENCNRLQRYFINEMKLVFKSINPDEEDEI